MPAKYECSICVRSFTYKETLDEHRLLHGIVIKAGHSFSCPICLKEVVCHHSSHNHTNGSSFLDDTGTQPNVVDENTVFDVEPSKDDSGSVTDTEPISYLSEADEVSRKPVNSNILDLNGKSGKTSSNQCEICSKTFVYHKCLIKHRLVHHGIKDDMHKRTNHETHGAATSNAANLSVNDSFSVEQLSSTVAETSTLNTDIQSDFCDQQDSSFTDDKTDEVGVTTRKRGRKKKGATVFTCKTCNKTLKNKTSLVRHWRVIHGRSNCDKCTCPVCLQIFDTQVVFSKHFDRAHSKLASGLMARNENSESDSNLTVTRCHPCKLWFTTRKSLLIHNGRKHRVVRCAITNKLKYKCFYCDAQFDTNKQLIYHRHNEHYVITSRMNRLKYMYSDVPVRKTVEPKPVVQLKAEDGQYSDDTDEVDDTDESSKQRQKPECEFLCDVCFKAFASAAHLLRHKRRKHGAKVDMTEKKTNSKPQKQLFVCGICSEEFTLEDSLAEHTEYMHKGQSSVPSECECPVCGTACENQSSFSMHYESVHCLKLEPGQTVCSEGLDDSVEQCNTCKNWFTDRKAMLAHQCPNKAPVRLKPAGRARYRCSRCGEAFESLRRFLHHRKVKHRVEGPDSVDGSESLPRTCLQEAPNASVLDDSSDAVEDPAKYCTRGRPPRFELSAPEQSTDDHYHQPQQQQQQQQQQYVVNQVSASVGDEASRNVGGDQGLKCPDCSQVFASISLLRKHRKIEHRNRTCQLCGVTCKSADMMYYHNLKYHHEQKCELCGASCPGRLGLINHFKSVHPNEPSPLINRKTLICEYCPRRFASCASRLLRDHIESCHLGRVHLCDVCGKRLGSAQTLAVHHRMHDPVARFECRECNRRFPHNTNLINHIRKHHPERLPAKYVREFRCDICSMQFGSSCGLTRHRSEKHSSSRHQCDQCLRVFQSATGLRVHKRREHSSKETAAEIASSTATNSDATGGNQAPLVMLPLPFNADPALMAGIIAGIPGIGHNFQTLSS